MNMIRVATTSWAWGTWKIGEGEGTGWSQITKSFVVHHKEPELYFKFGEKSLKGFNHESNIILCVLCKISFAIKWNMG